MTTHRKVIFLDIDGVLNSDRSIAAFDFEDHNSGNYWYDYLLSKCDPVAIALLNKITDVTDAVIFVSSANRKEMPLSEMTILLEKMGVTGEVVGYTPEIGYRGDEVDAIIAANDIDDYVIIDDMDQFHPHHKQHFVRTDMKYGLSYGNMQDAKRILGVVNSLLILI